MKPSIFIVGTQRSGTTLLAQMLTAHPRLFIKNELPDVGQIFAPDKSSERIMEDVGQVIQTTYGLDIDAFLHKTEKHRWGIKDPGLTAHLPVLSQQFPDARIIIIIRDGRAVASSYLKSKWGIANIYHGAQQWKREVTMQSRFLTHYPNQTFLVRYEDLIHDTQRTLQRVCAFLQEPYEAEMLAYHTAPIYMRKTKQNKNVFRALDPSLIEKWKTELSSFQVNIFESLAGDLLQQNHYPLIGEKIVISRSLQYWFDLQQKIIGELQIQYQWRIKKKTWKAQKNRAIPVT